MSEYHIGQPRFSAAIIASPAARATQLEQLASECGCLLRRFGEDCDFLLVARHSETEVDRQDWSEIADYLLTHDSEALVWSDLGDIDSAYAALPTGRCHFLVDAGDWQAVAILSGVARRARQYRMHDQARDPESLALQRISSELADFARTLARIAEQEEDTGSALRDKPTGFRPAPQGLFDAFT
jgi:hypothetical protein